MTYCVGLLTADGLVMVADTRTNAGIDNISIFKKLHVLVDTDERLIVAASAGSLSVTQSLLSLLYEGLSGETEDDPPRHVADEPTMFRVAQLVGDALRLAREPIVAGLAGTKISPNASLLLGGRIGDAPLTLFQIYTEGNFIECQPDAPFLQIGELKYGKPILDRALDYQTPIEECVKAALLSFDSTMRSNLSVGLPLDLIAISSNPGRAVVRRRIETDDTYFAELSQEWSRLLSEARAQLADPPFMNEDAPAVVDPETKTVVESTPVTT